MDFEQYKQKITEEFNKLLHAAETKNKLYYLLLLYGWGPHKASNDFIAQMNLITNRLLLDRIRNGRSEEIPPHEALLLLQINLEAKAYYAVLRNFAYLAAGQLVFPEPWKPNDEYSVIKSSGTAVLRTGKILANLVNDLKKAGFNLLSDEFAETHIKSVSHIRNSLAHATFLFPSPDTGDKWVFAHYEEQKLGFISVKRHEYTMNEFHELFARFFAFRLAFLKAFGEHQAAYNGKTFSFQAPNQKNAAEILDCRFDKGNIELKYQGTPLW